MFFFLCCKEFVIEFFLLPPLPSFFFSFFSPDKPPIMTDPRKVAINDTQPEDFIYTSEESKNPANQVVVIYSSRIKGRGSVFVVTRMAAVLSKTVKDAMEDLGDGAVAIPLPKEGITSEAFSKCFFWMENARNRTTEEVKEDEDTVKLPELTDYDTEMCDTMSDALKTNCIIAANYLNCKPLLDILLVSVAALAKARDLFFTPLFFSFLSSPFLPLAGSKPRGAPQVPRAHQEGHPRRPRQGGHRQGQR